MNIEKALGRIAELEVEVRLMHDDARDKEKRIQELQQALEPFALANRGCEHIQKVATMLHNASTGASAYVWWANRSLCVANFKAAMRALGL